MTLLRPRGYEGQAERTHLVDSKQRYEIMIGIRKKGLEHLVKFLGGKRPECVAVSKFYEDDESGTHKQAWWFDLPIDKIESNATDDYYLECEDRNDNFIVLRVPNKFLLDNRDRFDTKSRKNMIRLHLAAYPDKLFIDERVSDGMDFSRFKIS